MLSDVLSDIFLDEPVEILEHSQTLLDLPTWRENAARLEAVELGELMDVLLEDHGVDPRYGG